MEIITSAALIACCATVAALFYNLRKTYAEREQRIEEERLRGRSDDYVRPLNADLIMDAVRFNGMEPSLDGDVIAFDCNDEHWSLCFHKLPIVQVGKTYNLDDVDFGAMREAASRMSDDMVMAKAFVDAEAKDITFQIASVENSYGHLCSALPQYIKILDAAVSRHAEIYNEIIGNDGNADEPVAGSMMPEIPQSNAKHLLS